MAKAKKSKYIIWGIIGIIAIIVLLNWGNIKFMFDMLSSYKKYENMEGIDNDKTFEDTNPLLEAIEQRDSNAIDKTDDASNEENTAKNNDDIYITILSKYNEKFTSLQNEYEDALNSIISEGYSEYKNGTVSKPKLVSKYMSKGKTLEKESDANFNALVKEMEGELKKNGIDPSIAKDVKSYYYSYKENRQGEIMAKAMKAIN